MIYVQLLTIIPAACLAQIHKTSGQDYDNDFRKVPKGLDGSLICSTAPMSLHMLPRIPEFVSYSKMIM